MSSSLSRSTIEVLQLSCSEFLAASCSRRAVTSTIATGGFDEVVAPPDGELPVAPRRREAELPSSTEPRRVGEEPCRAADLGGASCEGRICSVVGGRESFDLRRPSFSRIFPKMLITMTSLVPTYGHSCPQARTLVRMGIVGSDVSKVLSVIFLIAVEEATVSDDY